VAAHLRAAGFKSATARQSREWRALRLIPPAELIRQGYAQPVLASNAPGTLDRALILTRAHAGRRVNRHVVVLRLFAQGHSVPEELLRSALRAYFIALRALLAKHTSADDPDEQAVELSEKSAHVMRRSKVGRFMLKRARKGFTDPDTAVVATSVQLVMTALLGGDVRGVAESGYADRDTLDELMELTGARGLYADEVPGVGAIVTGGREEAREDLLTALEASSLATLEGIATTTSLDRLEWARDSIVPVIDLLQSFSSNVRDQSGPTDAYGMAMGTVLSDDEESIVVLSLLLLAQAMYKGYEEFESGIAQLASTIRQQVALRRYLEAFPKPLRKLAVSGTEELLAAQPERVRAEVQRIFDTFAAEHPEDFEVLEGSK